MYMFSELTIWYWITNCYVIPCGRTFHSPPEVLSFLYHFCLGLRLLEPSPITLTCLFVAFLFSSCLACHVGETL